MVQRNSKVAIAVFVTLAVFALLAPAAASAGPTRIPQQAATLNVLAAPHTVNHVTIDYEVFEQLPGGLQIDDQAITDTAGLEVIGHEDQACLEPVNDTTKCLDTGTLSGVPNGSTGGGEDPSFFLGDGNDTFFSDTVGDVTVNAGPGNDKLTAGTRPMIFASIEGEPTAVVPSEEDFYGGAGNDVLIGRGQPDYLDGGAGNDRVVGGAGKDDLYGGPGNDLLDARDGHRDGVIDCGPGRKDKALVDPVDPKPKGCEL